MSAQVPPPIQPQPVPQQVIIHTAPGPAGTFVVIQINGPTGSHFTFLDAAGAQQVGQQLIDAAAQAKTGLVLARGVPQSPLNGHHGG